MSLFNSATPSTTSTATTVDQTITNTDNRTAEGNAAVGGNVTTGPGDINGRLSITTSDQGAIRGGLDLATEAIQTVASTVQGIQDAANSSVRSIQSSASDTVGQAYGLANEARQSETSGAINNVLKYGVWIALAGIIVYGIVRTQKS